MNNSTTKYVSLMYNTDISYNTIKRYNKGVKSLIYRNERHSNFLLSKYITQFELEIITQFE